MQHKLKNTAPREQRWLQLCRWHQSQWRLHRKTLEVSKQVVQEREQVMVVEARQGGCNQTLESAPIAIGRANW